MNSSLYAAIRPIILKFSVLALVSASLIFTAQAAQADSTLTVGLNPVSVVVDSQGNAYTANNGSGTISRISSSGVVSTFADLTPQKPTALVFGPNGNLYAATKTGIIYSITTAGTVTSFATVGKNPVAMLFDPAGNLFTANYTDSSISKVTPAGLVSLFAKVDTWPSGIVRDGSGNLYTTSYLDGIISKITPAGVVSQHATVGASPSAIVIDSSNNLFVTNSSDNTISKISTAGVETIFATVGKLPSALVIDSNNNLYTADYTDNTVTKVTSSGLVSTFTVTGNGPTALSLATNSNLYAANSLDNTVTVVNSSSSYASAPRSLQVNSSSSTQAELSWLSPLSDAGSAITDYLVEATTNSGKTLLASYRVGSTTTSFTFPGLCSKQSYQLKVYAINATGLSPASNAVTVTPPNGPAAYPTNISATLIKGTSVALAWEAPGCDGGAVITDYRISYSFDAGQNWVNVSRSASTATTATVTGLTLGRNYLFRISSVNSLGTGNPSVPLAVSTAESTAIYTVGSGPASMIADAAGNLYVANTVDNTISKITTTGVVSRFAIVGDNPTAMVFDASGNLFIANSDDSTISKVTPQGAVSVFATVGDRPTSLVIDKSGNLYSADSLSGTISKISPTGEVITFADIASNTVSLVIDAAGIIYSANGKDNTVSKITPAGQVSTLATLPITASRMITDTSGNLYVFSTVSASIYKITPAGQQSLFMTLTDSVTDMLIDAKNNFYFANSTDGTVSKLSPSGAVSTMAVFEDSIVRISTDSNGNLFTSFSEGKVAKSVMGKTATAPRTLTTSQISSSALTLTWQAPELDGGSALLDYRIEVSSNSGASWLAVSKPVSTSTTFQVTGLEQQTNYRFRIASLNGLGISPYSAEVTATTTAAALSTPRNLVASQITSTGLTLSWTSPTGTGGQSITDYTVEYSADAGSTWVMVSKPASTQTSAVISLPTPAKTYLFRVLAVTAVATSQPSATISATTLASVPTAPRTITFSSITKNSVTVNWLAPTTNNGSEITNYQVEISSSAGNSWTRIDKAISVSTSLLVTGLAPATNYQFRITAVNSIGESEYSQAQSVTTSPNPVPLAPSSVSFSNIKSNSVSITWSAVSSPVRVSNYLVDISTDGLTWTAIPKKISTINSLTVGNLLAGKNYKFRVAAVNTEGQSPFTTASVTTLATIPSAPGKPTATEITSNSITINWTASGNGGSEIQNYIVEQNSSNAGWVVVPKTISTSTSLTITDLNPATKYLFRVKAVNQVGYSKVSSSSTFTTLAVVPGIPTNLAIKSSTATSTVLTWLAPSNGGAKITDYKIEYSLDQGQTWQVWSKSASSSTTVTLKGLRANTDYLFRVSAKNSVGFGVASSSLTLTTP